MRLFIGLGALCLLLTIVLSSFAGYRDPVGGWRGIYPQKNMCCINTEFLLLPAFFSEELSRTVVLRIFRVAYILGSFVVIIFTGSSTGLLVLPALLILIVLVKLLRCLNARLRAVVLVLCSVLSTLLALIAFSSYTFIATSLGKDPTLTGRTEIWSALIAPILEHPILGFGYRAFWRGYEGESAGVSLASGWAVPSAHNAALEILVTLGFVGLVLVAWLCIKALRDSFTNLVHTDSPYARWYATTVILMILYSVDEAELVVPFGLAWFLFALAAVNLSNLTKHIGVDRG